MKKIFKTFVLLILLFILTACSCKGCSKEHVHTFSSDYHFNETTHWLYATCEHTDLKEGEVPHTFTTTTTPATFDAAGKVVHSCFCGYSYTEVLPQLVHSYSSEWSHDETHHFHACTDAGYESLRQDEALHSFEKTTIDPTYVAAGKEVYTCSCGYSYEVEIPKLEHVHEIELVKAKTVGCEEDGWIQHYECSLCHAYFADSLGKTELSADAVIIEHLGHDYVFHHFSFSEDGKSATAHYNCSRDASHTTTYEATVTSAVKVQATCEVMGTTLYTAAYDGHETSCEKQDIPALNHEYDFDHFEWALDNRSAQAVLVCKHDSAHTEKVAAVMSHNDKVAPTCTEAGLVEYVATYEGHVDQKDVEEEALGHDFSGEYLSNNYQHWHKCSRCDEVADIGDHTYDEGAPSVEATLEAKGTMRYTCTVCGHYYEEEYDYYTVGLKYELVDNDHYIVKSYDQATDLDVIVPKTYRGLPVTEIADSAFYNTAITKAVLPDSITSIGNRAFHSCLDLQEVVLTDAVKTIGSYAFYNCKKLETIQLPKDLTIINDYAFYYCEELEEITLPDTVKTISEYAFYHCASLSGIILPNELETIKTNAFSYSGLTSIVVPKSVQAIGLGAFNNTRELEEITIPFIGQTRENARWFGYIFGGQSLYANADYVPSSLKKVSFNDELETIWSYSFYSCTNLETVKFPDSVSLIDNYAFYQCYSLKDLQLPSSLEKISSYAFQGCTALTEIVIPDSVKTLANFAFHNCGDVEVSFTENTNLENIYQDTFYYSSITKLTIPSKILTKFTNSFTIRAVELIDGKEIPYRGFYYWGNLKSVTLPDSITSIGDEAFYCCSALTEITIPAAVTTIGKSAFSSCGKLTTVNFVEDSELTSIGNQAFESCGKLTTITFPEELKQIGVGVFRWDSSLKDINFNDKIESIGYQAFYGTAPEEIVLGTSVKTIGEFAFGNCYQITKMTLPFIGKTSTEKQYLGCIFGASDYSSNYSYVPSKLKEVVILDGCQAISEYAFYGLPSLTTITIPDSVTSIGAFAFYNCNAIEEITLPASLQTIGAKAFYGCSGLKEIEIPSLVESIGDQTFYGCSNLLEVINKAALTIEARSKTNGWVAYYAVSVVSDKADSTLIRADDGFVYIQDGSDKLLVKYYGNASEVVIDDSITKIYDRAFRGNTSIKSVTIPSGVTVIGSNAFDDCKNLRNVVFLDGSTLTTINDYAFYSCKNLISFEIPSSVTTIEYQAFYECWRLVEIINHSELKLTLGSDTYGYIAYYAYGIETDKANSKISANGDFIGYQSGEDNIVVAYDGNDEEINIPNTYTIINRCFMHDNNSITSLNIPSSIRTIKERAFNSCRNLTVVTIEEGSVLTSINTYAFASCNALTSINIPDSVTKFGPYSFQWCNQLTAINIPEGVTSIDTCTFNGCSALVSVTLPSTLKTIYQSAFSGCSAIIELTIPANVEHIYNYVFSSCSKLEKVIFEDGSKLTTLGNEVFGYCYALKEIELPSSLTTIGDYTFRYCNKLEKVTLPKSLTKIGNGAFYECYKLNNIIYLGASTEWSSVTKGGSWVQSTDVTVIHCTDKDVEL